MAPEQSGSSAFRKHVTDMLSRYQRVTAVNLANHHGSEGSLTTALERAAKRWAASPSPGLGTFRLLNFDFHKECGTTKYWNLAKLYVQIEADLHSMGVYRWTTPAAQPAMPVSRQTGVIRTNCIDCLDRTNVVQALLARRQLEAFMGDLLLPGGGVLVDLRRRVPALDKQLRFMWADHGDAVSMHYAGTGALKSGFTRTGKRTILGLIDDGWKSTMRYYKNNLVDGTRQDIIDLAVGASHGRQNEKGAGEMGSVTPGPVYGENKSPALWVVFGLALLSYSIANALLVSTLMVVGIALGVGRVLGLVPKKAAPVLESEPSDDGQAARDEGGGSAEVVESAEEHVVSGEIGGEVGQTASDEVVYADETREATTTAEIEVEDSSEVEVVESATENAEQEEASSSSAVDGEEGEDKSEGESEAIGGKEGTGSGAGPEAGWRGVQDAATSFLSRTMGRFLGTWSPTGPLPT